MPERCVVFGCNNVQSKEKGSYCFIPYPFTVKLSPKSKKEAKVDRFCEIKTCSLGTHRAFGDVL